MGLHSLARTWLIIDRIFSEGNRSRNDCCARFGSAALFIRLFRHECARSGEHRCVQLYLCFGDQNVRAASDDPARCSSLVLAVNRECPKRVSSRQSGKRGCADHPRSWLRLLASRKHYQCSSTAAGLGELASGNNNMPKWKELFDNEVGPQRWEPAASRAANA
jgi:hypothetical protein